MNFTFSTPILKILNLFFNRPKSLDIKKIFFGNNILILENKKPNTIYVILAYNKLINDIGNNHIKKNIILIGEIIKISLILHMIYFFLLIIPYFSVQTPLKYFIPLSHI